MDVLEGKVVLVLEVPPSVLEGRSERLYCSRQVVKLKTH